jgi:hypothetical protein
MIVLSRRQLMAARARVAGHPSTIPRSPFAFILGRTSHRSGQRTGAKDRQCDERTDVLGTDGWGWNLRDADVKLVHFLIAHRGVEEHQNGKV